MQGEDWGTEALVWEVLGSVRSLSTSRDQALGVIQLLKHWPTVELRQGGCAAPHLPAGGAHGQVEPKASCKVWLLLADPWLVSNTFLFLFHISCILSLCPSTKQTGLGADRVFPWGFQFGFAVWDGSALLLGCRLQPDLVLPST